MSEEKKGFLFIEQDKNLRSYYSVALNSSGLYQMFVCAGGNDVFEKIADQKSGAIQIILLSDNLTDIPFHLLIQKLRNNPITFQAHIYLFSSGIQEEDKFILKEMSIKQVLPMQMDVQSLLVTLKKSEAQNANTPFESSTLKLEFALKNKELQNCETLLADPKLKAYLTQSTEFVPLLGDYHLLKKEYEECQHLLNEFIHNHEKNMDVADTMKILNCLGKALCLSGKFKEATQIYEKLSAKSPKNLEHKVNLSSTLIATGDWAKSDNILKSILEIDPENKTALTNQVQTKVALNKMEEAKSLLDKIAGSIESSSISSFFNNRGIAAMHEGEYDKAESFYKNALFFAKKDLGKILFNLGLCLYKNNKTQEADKIFDKIKETSDFEFLVKTKTILQKVK